MTVKPTGFVSILCILLITGCTPSEEIDNASPWFSEVAVASGIDFVHHSGYDGRPMMPEMMGGGVALADIDRDNDLDLYLVQSGRVDRSPPTEQSANVLYLNRGNGHFEKVPDAAGAIDRGYGMGWRPRTMTMMATWICMSRILRPMCCCRMMAVVIHNVTDFVVLAIPVGHCCHVSRP